VSKQTYPEYPWRVACAALAGEVGFSFLISFLCAPILIQFARASDNDGEYVY
jgi:hypothetical protein